MRLAKAVGLSVPEVDIYWLNDQPYYVVQRYDRCVDETGQIIRLHQEDFCQILHIPPEQKYENEGGPRWVQCFEILGDRIRRGVMAGKNKITLFQAAIFNFLIGNGDAHGKNFSLLYEGGSERMTPFYDLLSTLIYSNAFKAQMAMKIHNTYKFRDIRAYHFEKLGQALGFRTDFVHHQIKKMCSATLKAAQHLSQSLSGKTVKNTSVIYARITSVVERQRSQLFL
jgi:serine/threonine-protein kinase HipA